MYDIAQFRALCGRRKPERPWWKPLQAEGDEQVKVIKPRLKITPGVVELPVSPPCTLAWCRVNNKKNIYFFLSQNYNLFIIKSQPLIKMDIFCYLNITPLKKVKKLSVNRELMIRIKTIPSSPYRSSCISSGSAGAAFHHQDGGSCTHVENKWRRIANKRTH